MTEFQNNLREALNRASGGGGMGAPMGSGLPTLTGLSSDVPADNSPGEMILPRMVIPRVKIKQEVAAYIESCFLSRTNIDGSILRPSKEQLIEDMTGLFHNMEEQAGYIDEPKARRSSPRGRSSEA